jgi:lysophospholipase L1-like esterase
MKRLAVFLTGLGLMTHPAFADTPLPLHIGGRVATIDNGYRHQWPGTYFEGRFNGPTVTIRLDDKVNFFNVLIDNKPYSRLERQGSADFVVDHLAHGPHTIRLEKRTETQDATGDFKGFFVSGPAQALPAPSRKRQIEFIGDSDVVGFAAHSHQHECTEDERFVTTDTQIAYGSLLARRYDADYQVNAYSGLGMVRNYDGTKLDIDMPRLYPRVLFDDPKPYDRQGWRPQFIVFAIGGNDFTTPVRASEKWHDTAGLRADFEKQYMTFIRSVRAQNPDAFLLLTIHDHFNDDYFASVNAVYQAVSQSGEKRIALIHFPKLEAMTCWYHPTPDDHKTLAGQLSAYIDAHPELWQGK